MNISSLSPNLTRGNQKSGQWLMVRWWLYSQFPNFLHHWLQKSQDDWNYFYHWELSVLKELSNHFRSPGHIEHERFNPFTLRVPLERIVCYSHTFGKNLRIKQNFANIWIRVVVWLMLNISPTNVFQKNVFVSKIFPKASGLLWLLWV